MTTAKPFELPHGWEWARIGHIGHDWGQKTPDSDFTYIEVSAIDSQRGVISSPELVKPENAPSRARKVVKEGTVIYSTIRPYLLNIAVIEEDFLPEPIASTAFAIVHPFCSMPPRFFLCFFRSPVFVRYVESVQMGIAYPAINDGQFFSALIPLPPIAEQHRIVAKVDELMALCDQLETRHGNAADAHEKLVSHLLGTLTQSQNAEDFSANWQRIAAHFDTLFNTEASIDTLKQTLLQLAVMGKLVPQDANDEHASVLLRRLADDGKKYAAKLRIAQPKPEPISTANLPNFAPEGWVWTRLCSIFRVITDGDHQSPPQVEDGVPFLTIGNITTGCLDFSGCRFVPLNYFESVASYRRPEFGDILYTVVGATYGRPVFVDSHQKFCVQRHIAILKCSEHLDVKFACYLLSSPEVYEQATQCTTGTAQPTIPLRPLRNFLILLPPLAEQHRIVTKVDELMSLCDRLKSRITDASQLQQKLADVLVAQAVA